MLTFLTDLFNSIFTPGPTPTLLVATNVSFAALQIVLLVLLIATYSVHFMALSALCAGLWFLINWFVNELQAANVKEEKAKRLRQMTDSQTKGGADDSGTETEGTENLEKRATSDIHNAQHLGTGNSSDILRQRRSLGDMSTDRSEDSEWEKVSEQGASQE